MFYSHTQAEVLSSMEDMKNMLNGLRRRHSVLSLRSVASFAPSVKTKEAMKQLCRDLYRAGVTADVIRDRKDQAVTLFQHPAAPPMDNLGVPRPAGSVAILHGEEPLEERQKGKGRNPTSGTNSTPFRGSALHVAAAIGFRQGVQLLLANGAYIEATRSDDGSTPLDTAAFNGHTEVVRLLLEKGANIEATRSNDGSTPLHTAAYNGHIGMVRLLLEKGANIEATTSDTGLTPLDGAAYNGHTDVVRLLLEKGANIEATRSNTGATPLDTAAFNGHIDVVRLLLEKRANIEATRSDGSTALYCASWRGHVGVVSLLLDKGANTEAARTDNESTTLHVAAWYLQTEVVRLLLEKGANIHAASNQAYTALHMVFYVAGVDPHLKDPKQLIPAITVLLAHGANMLQKDEDGDTPLDLAEQCGHPKAKQLFLQHLKERNLKPPQEA